MELAWSSHGIGIFPGRTGTVQIDDLRSCRRRRGTISCVRSARSAARQQYFAGVVHHSRSPVTGAVVVIINHGPGTGTRYVEIAGGLTRTGTENVAVRCYKHERIKW